MLSPAGSPVTLTAPLSTPSPAATAAELGDWRNEEETRAFYRLLVEKMGPDRVGWSEAGFNGLPSVGGGRQPPLL